MFVLNYCYPAVKTVSAYFFLSTNQSSIIILNMGKMNVKKEISFVKCIYEYSLDILVIRKESQNEKKIHRCNHVVQHSKN